MLGCQLCQKVCWAKKISSQCYCFFTEPQPEPADTTAQVLRFVLLSVCREEHPLCGDEQPPPLVHQTAWKIRPERQHVQTEGLETRARKEISNAEGLGFRWASPWGDYVGGWDVYSSDENDRTGLQSESCYPTIFLPLTMFNFVAN